VTSFFVEASSCTNLLRLEPWPLHVVSLEDAEACVELVLAGCPKLQSVDLSYSRKSVSEPEWNRFLQHGEFLSLVFVLLIRYSPSQIFPSRI
jgi:hypothetical protein